MSPACKSALAAIMLAATAGADVFTNYTLYGWSSPAWPSDTTNALRGSYISMPAYINTNSVGGVVVWSNTVDGVRSNYYSVNPIVAWPEDGLPSVSMMLIPSNDVHAAFHMQTTDRRAYELFLALYERTAHVRGFTWGSGGSKECDDFGPWYYRYDHRNLAMFKDVLDELVSHFADVRVATNALQPEALPYSADGVSVGDYAPYSGRFSVDPYGTPPTDIIPRWTAEGLCAAAGAPSNWLSYTPWRQLEGAGTNGVGRVHNASWTIKTTVTNGVGTNTVVDYWSDSRAITGTNGQLVTLTITNSAIEDGRTTLDYGWRRAERIVSLLAWPVVEYRTEGVTNIDGDSQWGEEGALTEYTDDRWDAFVVAVECDDNIDQALNNWSNDFTASADSYACVTRIDSELNEFTGDAYAIADGFRSVGRRTVVSPQIQDVCSYNTNVVPPFVCQHGPSNCWYEVYAYATPYDDVDGLPDIAVWDRYGTAFYTSNVVFAVLQELALDSPDRGHLFIPYTNAALPTFETINDTQWAPCLNFTWVYSSTAGICLRVATNEYSRGFQSNLGNAEVLLRPGWRFGATIDCPALNPAGWSTTTSSSTSTDTSTTTSSSTSTDTSTTSSTTTTCGPP